MDATPAILAALLRIEALLRENNTVRITRKEQARRQGVHPGTLRRREVRAQIRRMVTPL